MQCLLNVGYDEGTFKREIRPLIKSLLPGSRVGGHRHDYRIFVGSALSQVFYDRYVARHVVTVQEYCFELGH
jgi:hypothetical protein